MAAGHGAIVVGAGPSGLATAAELQRHGVRPRVLERGTGVGDSWRNHYDRLHLHTARRLSGLPGMPIPKRYGKWVSRQDLVRYLEDYAAHHALDVETGVRVTAIRRDDGRWLVEFEGGRSSAALVVVATGYNRIPDMPQWPGMASFGGTLIHASAYRNPAPYAGRRVLVVGSGNTGAEIALDLVEGGAAQVWLSVRTPPNIQRRELLGLPMQYVGIASGFLSPRAIDWISLRLQRAAFGDLQKRGLLPFPANGIHTRALGEERIPLIDVGTIAAIRRGAIKVVGAVQGFEGASVLLASGDSLQPDDVVAATGYRRGLEDLVGHLGVLDERGRPLARGPVTVTGAPGLHFVGYDNGLGGLLRNSAREAVATARAAAHSHPR